MKEEEVSTLGLESQDWELVSEMVAETENSVTDFFQGDHVKLDEPKPDLSKFWKAKEETMTKLTLGTAASGVEAPPLEPEGAASATDVPMAAAVKRMDLATSG